MPDQDATSPDDRPYTPLSPAEALAKARDWAVWAEFKAATAALDARSAEYDAKVARDLAARREAKARGSPSQSEDVSEGEGAEDLWATPHPWEPLFLRQARALVALLGHHLPADRLQAVLPILYRWTRRELNAAVAEAAGIVSDMTPEEAEREVEFAHFQSVQSRLRRFDE